MIRLLISTNPRMPPPVPVWLVPFLPTPPDLPDLAFAFGRWVNDPELVVTAEAWKERLQRWEKGTAHAVGCHAVQTVALWTKAPREPHRETPRRPAPARPSASDQRIGDTATSPADVPGTPQLLHRTTFDVLASGIGACLATTCHF